MDRQSEDDAWRAIVENYGDQVLPADERARGERPDRPERPAGPPSAAVPPPVDPAPAWDPKPFTDPFGEAERFVPPVPPPIPRPTGPRAVAWAGVVVAPLLLLLALVGGFGLPALIGYGLVAWFVGGFVWLVAHLPRGPQDPWDDGARV